MDEKTLADYILKCRLLRHKFVGVFPSDYFICPLPTNTFAIVNTAPLMEKGEHWVVYANRDGCHIFADPLGSKLSEYQQIHWRMVTSLSVVFELINKPLQPPTSKLCGMWCLFLAHTMFQNELPTYVPMIDEVELLRFVKHVL